MVGIWCSLEKAFNLSVHVGIYFQNKIFGVSGVENRGMGVIVSVQFSCSVVSDSLRPHELQHARPPCPSTPGAYTNSCPSCWWCHPAISSSVIPFSSCLRSFPASRSFPMSRLFASGSQSIGASASVLPMNIQNWFPWGLTGLFSLQSKGLLRVFPSTIVRRHQFFGALPFLLSSFHK